MAAGTDNGLRLDINNTITTIVVPQNGNGGIYAAGIDNLGSVVYVFNDASSGSFFRDSSGNYQTIYVPGSVYTEVQGMNNQGEVVGFYYDGITSHGFLWTGGDNYTTIDFPGADFTVLSGINEWHDHGTLFIP